MTETQVLHLAPWIGRTSFGVGPVVLNLVHAQTENGCNAIVWCTDSQADVRETAAKNGLTASQVQPFAVLGPSRLAFSPSMEREARHRAVQFDIVHTHGIWTSVSRVANLLRTKADKPIVLAPHGSLDPWALQRSRLKKRLALVLYESRNLHSSACLHALSEREAAGCRSYGLRQPIAVIPNGIDATWLEMEGNPAAFRTRHNTGATTRLALFLGRITPIKGLPLLLRAIRACSRELDNWLFIIAGSDEFGHEKELQALLEQLELQSMVRFVGPLYDQHKRDAFAAADFFVLPSHSEGAPIVILEALGAGVPVLATKASPWPELMTDACGWWTEISVEGIGAALLDASRKSKVELGDMGRRGKQLVAKKYTWSHISKQTLTLYDWLIHGGAQPDFVRTE